MRFSQCILLTGTVVICFACPSQGAQSQGGGADDSAAVELKHTPGEVTLAQITYGGRTRDYRYYVPRGFDMAKQHPLILVLHGYNQPIDSMVRTFAPAHSNADKDGTIIVYPVSTGSMEQNNLAWNTTYGRLGLTDDVNDIGYLTFLMDLFLRKLNGDPDQVYVTGTSMGGAMTYTLGCYIPERLAAIAPVIMQMGKPLVEKFPHAKPLPIMMITGTADPLVPASGLSGADRTKEARRCRRIDGVS